MKEWLGYIQAYPCKCSGGDVCFIVRHPKIEVNPSFATFEEAYEHLLELNEFYYCKLCKKDVSNYQFLCASCWDERQGSS